jgi:hypothetical protein
MMGQILHIFRKDVRHFWIEILGSILVLSGYIWRVLYEWANPLAASEVRNPLQGILMVLVPISWCLLVVRVVQDESLVGDRQFWVTRPYVWKKLVAAKALFIFLFVSVPLFTANAIFLKSSGFAPTRHLVGLLWVQLSIVLILILPAACVSVVTSTFVQVVLWTLGIGGYIAIVASLSSLIPDSHIQTSISDISDWIAPAAFGVVFLGIVLWQYRQRRPWIPRAVIVTMALIMAAGGLVPTTESQVTEAYPPLAAGEQLPFHLTPIPPKPATEEQEQSQAREKKISLTIKMRLTDIPAGTLITIAAARVTARTRNGEELTTKWANDGTEIWPHEATTSVGFQVDRNFFENARFVPTDLRVTLAYREYHETNTRQIVTQSGEFPVDGVGICWVYSPRAEIWLAGSMQCRSAVKAPAILARFETAQSTCPHVRNKTEAPATTRYASFLTDNSVEPVIIPIQSVNLRFTQVYDPDDEYVVPDVCVGTPVTLSTPTAPRFASTEIKIDGADLRDYLPEPIGNRRLTVR